jgi:hypothetical protein
MALRGGWVAVPEQAIEAFAVSFGACRPVISDGRTGEARAS